MTTNCQMLLLACLALVSVMTILGQAKSLNRSKREAYKLPAGAKEIMQKDIKTTFKCEKDGYYADVDNDCKIFHRCHGDASRHHSFICGEGTVFDQSTFTCHHSDDAIPCSESHMFYDLNERLGTDGPFLTDADVDRAKKARPQYAARA